jgi:hypothetical protein
MKRTHTIGNWIAHDGQIYPEETGKTLALIPYFDKEDKEQEANARLIAAAPELLTACLVASEELCFGGDWNTAKRVIQDAINKATEQIKDSNK